MYIHNNQCLNTSAGRLSDNTQWWVWCSDFADDSVPSQCEAYGRVEGWAKDFSDCTGDSDGE
jgi:hypothetical protein